MITSFYNTFSNVDDGRNMSTNLFLIILVWTITLCAGAGLQRTNIALIVDVGRGNLQYSKELTKNILDRISLLEYRFSLYSTNGVKQRFMDFQSRQCTVAKLRKSFRRRKRLTSVTKLALKDLRGPFPDDDNIVLILTDKKSQPWLKKLFNRISNLRNNRGVYVNQIKYRRPVRRRNRYSLRWRPSHSVWHNYFYKGRDFRYDNRHGDVIKFKYDANNNDDDADDDDDADYDDDDDDDDIANKNDDEDSYDDSDGDIEHDDKPKKRKRRSLNSKVNILRKRNVEIVVEAVPFLKVRTCSVSGVVRDECNRRCVCVDGKLTDCYRIRREFSSMTKEQRLRFINVYKKFSSDPKYRRLYGSYVQKHFRFFYKGLHSLPQFLPWHRRYILGFENYLRAFDCRITVPYWNWALHGKEAWNVTDKHVTWSHESGLGGNGNKKQGYCVTDGPFAQDKWEPPRYENTKKLIQGMCGNNEEDQADNAWFVSKYLLKLCANKRLLKKVYSGPRCLRRRFSGKTPTYKNLYATITTLSNRNFLHFESVVRQDWHNQVHNRVGGEMETDYSSHTPEFWMHHGMLDCAWEKWQQKGHAYKYDHFRNKKKTLLSFSPPELRYKFVHNDNLDNCGVKVTCENVLPIKLHLKKVFHYHH